ncbi:hypothetical protein [Halopelagius longus]|uniref:Uncharacterized protein n=1 Tax=Halopelagius longus TaxID=1236180 RepID=A0A1H1A9D7_9EURY|nr:hypothetical protein [Halopelagius longus]SDQ35926.1 hypothetical protein SAMN05216278_1214 [Halopelagius longus]
MTSSVVERAVRGGKKLARRGLAPVERAFAASRRALHSLRRDVTAWATESDDSEEEWTLKHSRRTESKWVRGDETVRCFRFDDGYVSTVEYESRGATWQLTPGQVPLSNALAMATLFLQHEVTPQIDPEGRPFVGVGDAGPRHVFEEIADEPVEYVYLDEHRTLEEFPPFLDVTDQLRLVYDRMSPERYRTLDDEQGSVG